MAFKESWGIAKFLLFLNVTLSIGTMGAIAKEVVIASLNKSNVPGNIDSMILLALCGVFVFGTYRRLQKALVQTEINEKLALGVFYNIGAVSLLAYSISFPLLIVTIFSHS